MTEAYEVPQPILNSPFAEPTAHWYIREGESPEQRPSRRPRSCIHRVMNATIAMWSGCAVAAPVVAADLPPSDRLPTRRTG